MTYVTPVGYFHNNGGIKIIARKTILDILIKKFRYSLSSKSIQWLLASAFIIMKIPNGWMYRIVFAQWVFIAGIFKKKQPSPQTIYPEKENKQGDRRALSFALLVIILYIIYKRISGI